MKKILLVLLIGLFYSGISLSAQDSGLESANNTIREKNVPVVNVETLYLDDKNQGTDNLSQLGKRQLYDLLIDQYSKAKALEAQVKTLGLKPDAPVPVLPSEITKNRKNRELRGLIIQYNKTAKTLEHQILVSEKMTIQRLQILLDSTQKSIFEMTYIHEVDKLKLYEEQRRKLEDYYEKLRQEKLNELFKNSVQVFNVSILGRQYFLPGSGVSSDFSLGGKFELSLYPIFNGADFLEIYGEFMKPIFYTHDALNNEYAWNINWYSTGINLKIPGRLDLNAFTVGMRIGGGYYWGEARQYNTGFDKSNWRGYNLNFEIDFMKYSWFYPLDLFIQYSLYYPTQDFTFNTGDGTINLGKSMYSGLSVGMRLCLWWENKY